MGSTRDQLVSWYTTCLYLWILMSLLSPSVYAGFTSVWCAAEPSDRLTNYLPACEYVEGDVVWFNAEVGTGANLFSSDFNTALIYTREGCLDEAELTFGDPTIDCTKSASAVEDYGPIAIEFEGTCLCETLGMFPIETVDDCDVEDDEVFSVYSRPQPFRPIEDLALPDSGAEVVIKDNDDNYYFEFGHYDVVEGIGTKTIVTLNVKRRGVLQDKIIEYSTTGLTAEATYDFAPKKKANIRFEEGSESKNVTIEIIADMEMEGPELFYVELIFPSDPDPKVCTGKIVHPSKAYVQIHDPETTLYYLEHSIYSVSEPGSGEKTLTFNIKRKGNLTRTSTLEYSVRDVSTTLWHDYVLPQKQVVFFKEGSVNAEVSIIIKSDTSTEYPEEFEVSIEVSPEEGFITSPAKATVIIEDYSTTRSCVGFDTPMFTVFESDGMVDLIIRRIGNVEESVTVDITTTDMDAKSQQDYHRLLDFPVYFGSDETLTTVTLTILEDQEKEDTESLKVSLTKSIESPDNVDICSPEAQILIKDDDDEFFLEGTLYKVKEGDTFEINILRCGYLKKESTVRVNFIPGSATSLDYTVVNGDTSITFDVNQQFHTLVITANDDQVVEDEEEFTVQLMPDFDEAQIGVPYHAKIVITSGDSLCVPACVNGECIDVNTCQCPPEFTGSLCEVSFLRSIDADLCVPPCVNGDCIGVNTCDCQIGFTGSLCETALQLLPGSITIEELPPGNPLVFTDDLNDPTSLAYQQLKADVEALLTDIFINLPGFLYVIVLFFSEGSVMVTYDVVFDAESSIDGSEINELLMENIDDTGILGNSDFKLDPTNIINSAGGSSTSNSDEFISIILGGASMILFLLLFLCFAFLWVRTRLQKTPIQQPQAVQQHSPAVQQLPNQQVTLVPYEGVDSIPYGGDNGQGQSSLMF